MIVLIKHQRFDEIKSIQRKREGGKGGKGKGKREEKKLVHKDSGRVYKGRGKREVVFTKKEG